MCRLNLQSLLFLLLFTNQFIICLDIIFQPVLKFNPCSGNSWFYGSDGSMRGKCYFIIGQALQLSQYNCNPEMFRKSLYFVFDNLVQLNRHGFFCRFMSIIGDLCVFFAFIRAVIVYRNCLRPSGRFSQFIIEKICDYLIKPTPESFWIFKLIKPLAILIKASWVKSAIFSLFLLK